MLVELNELKRLIGVPHQTVDGYLVCYKKNKEELFKVLEDNGFFEFHTTNNGFVVSVQQIIAFFNYGYKALANGFTANYGEVEVHHLDSNCFNNEPHNLVYLSCHDHYIVSQASKTPFFDKPAKERITTPFNKQGRKIVGHNRFLASIIDITISFIAKLCPDFLARVWLEAIQFIDSFDLISLSKQAIKNLFVKHWKFSSVATY